MECFEPLTNEEKFFIGSSHFINRKFYGAFEGWPVNTDEIFFDGFLIFAVEGLEKRLVAEASRTKEIRRGGLYFPRILGVLLLGSEIGIVDFFIPRCLRFLGVVRKTCSVFEDDGRFIR